MSCITTNFYPHDQPSISRHIADLDENSVRWTECVHAAWRRDGIRHFLELGPQDTLCGLVKDNEPRAFCLSAGRKGREVEGMRQTCARLYALGHLSKKAISVRIDDIRQGKDAVVAAHTPLPHCGLVPVDLPDGGSDCGPDCGTAYERDVYKRQVRPRIRLPEAAGSGRCKQAPPCPWHGASLAEQTSPTPCDFSDVAHSFPQMEMVPPSPSPVPMARPVRLLEMCIRDRHKFGACGAGLVKWPSHDEVWLRAVY